MRCARCKAELAHESKYCSECGFRVESVSVVSAAASGAAPPGDEDEGALELPSGFSRTLSTELVAKQIELRSRAKLSALVQSRAFQPGEILIRKGDMKRDLFFLTEGAVAISRKEGDEELILNEIEPPYILGEIAFLFGMPRTATATAKTEVKAFILKYEDLSELLKELPPWLPSLLTSLASGIKSLHYKVQTLDKSQAEGAARRA